MRKPTVIYEAFDVVVVPFPFTDRSTTKRRPALVLSNGTAFNFPTGQSVMAMITSQKNPSWPLDVPLSDILAAGLPSASVVRMKFFALDNRLILRRTGLLGGSDQQSVKDALGRLLPLV